jgi:hypothetical protein
MRPAARRAPAPACGQPPAALPPDDLQGFPQGGNIFSIAWKIAETFFHCVEKTPLFFPHRGKLPSLDAL